MTSRRSVPPVTAAGFQVLLSLADGPAHGYAIMQVVEEISGGAVRLGPGTLYRTLSRLLADGLVEEAGDGDHGDAHDARRRYYRLTPTGHGAAREEARLLERMVAAARAARLLADGADRGWSRPGHVADA